MESGLSGPTIRGMAMNPNSIIFLMTVIVGGLLIVTLFFYGGQLMLRFLEVSDTAKVRAYAPATVAHTDSSPGAPTLNHVGAADSQSAALRL